MSSALAYLPEYYPGESFYSYFARYRADLGLSQVVACDAIFGRFVQISTSGIQVGLADALPRLRSPQFPDIEALIETTTWKYYTAFHSAEREFDLRRSMLRSARWTPSCLGLSNTGIRPHPALLFCTDCVAEMEARYLNVHWRRVHQLPGVLLCPDHQTILMASSVPTTVKAALNPVTAEAAMLLPARPIVNGALPDAAREILLELAKRSAHLLAPDTVLQDRGCSPAYYRDRLAEVGLKDGMLVQRNELRLRFSSYVSPISDLLAGVSPLGPRARAATPMWNNSARTAHPMRHLLFRMFLDVARETTTFQPVGQIHGFGEGPWPCRNPLCDYVDQDVVTSFWLSPNKSMTGELLGYFSCAHCGFVFRLTGSLEGRMRVLQRGQRFTERVKELGPFMTVGQLARALNVSADLVKRYAREAEVRLRPPRRWVPKTVRQPSPVADLRRSLLDILAQEATIARSELRRRYRRLMGRLAEEDPDWLHEHLPPKKPLERRDWATFDIQMLGKITTIAEEMKRAVPLVRVSARQILLRIGSLSWRRAKTYESKLPRTLALLAEIDESIDEYQDRRIAWAISTLKTEGERIVATNVARKARLDGNARWKARKAVEAASL